MIGVHILGWGASRLVFKNCVASTNDQFDESRGKEGSSDVATTSACRPRERFRRCAPGTHVSTNTSAKHLGGGSFHPLLRISYGNDAFLSECASEARGVATTHQPNSGARGKIGRFTSALGL